MPLQLEDGSYLLLEDGVRLLLEDDADPSPVNAAVRARRRGPNRATPGSRINRAHPIGAAVTCLVAGFAGAPVEIVTNTLLTPVGIGFQWATMPKGPAAIATRADSDGWRLAPPPDTLRPSNPGALIAAGWKPTGLVGTLFGIEVTAGGPPFDIARLRGSAAAAFLSLEIYDGTTFAGVTDSSTNFTNFAGDFVVVANWGPGGSELWLNGVRLATSATAINTLNFGNTHRLDFFCKEVPTGGALHYGAYLNRNLGPHEIIALTNDPFLFLTRPRRRLADTAVNVAGTIAVTEASDTTAIVGAHGVAGTIAATEANDTTAIVGAHGVAGTIAVTEANDTTAIVGAHGVAGTIAATEANDTMTATGLRGHTGTIAATEENDTMTATGAVTVPGVTGTIAVTESNDTMTAIGDFAVVGSNAVTLTVRDRGHTSTAKEGEMNFDLRYHHLAEEPAAKLWLIDDDYTLIDYSIGSTTWNLQILRRLGDAVPLVNKTSGITGTAGSGVEPTGVPNCTIVWSTGELAVLTPGIYAATLRATQSGRDRVFIGTFTAF